MASLLAQLARGMIFAHRDYNELGRKKSKKKSNKKRRGSRVCELSTFPHDSMIDSVPNDNFMFARMPPDPPSDCQVVYSISIE